MSLLLLSGNTVPLAPTSLSTLVAWYSARTLGSLWQDSGRTTPVAANADPVGAWDDLSGNARHIVQATAGSRPAYSAAGFNGYPCLTFDGTDDFLASVAAWVATVFGGTDKPYAVAAVCRTTTIGPRSVIGTASTGGATQQNRFSYSSADSLQITRTNDAAATVNNTPPSGGLSTNVPYVLSGIYTGATSELFAGYTRIYQPTAAGTGANTMDKFAVGALPRPTPATFWVGDIAEVVIATSLTPRELTGVTKYLLSRYGLG